MALSSKPLDVFANISGKTPIMTGDGIVAGIKTKNYEKTYATTNGRT